MPYKKQKAIRSNKKDVICDLMTDLSLTNYANVLVILKRKNSEDKPLLLKGIIVVWVWLCESGSEIKKTAYGY